MEQRGHSASGRASGRSARGAGPPLGVADLASLLTLVAALWGWIAWIDRFSEPMEADETNLISMSLCARDALQRADLGALYGCPPGHPYPPLVPTLAGIALLPVESIGMREIALTTLPWCGLLSVVAWAALRRSAGPWGGLVGVAAAIGLCTTPSVWGHLYTELPMSALGLGAAAIWSRSGGLSRPWTAAALGLVLGLGLLTKWTFAFFLGPPVAILVGYTLLRAPSRPVLGLLAALSGAAAGAGYSLAVAGLGGPVVFAWPAPAALCAVFLLGDAVLTHFWGRGPRQPRLGAAVGVGALALCTAAVAAPWYIRRAQHVLEFLALNLQAGNYDGDLMAFSETWPFYPIVVASTFGRLSLALLGIGVLRALWARDRLALFGLVAFLFGAGFLMAAPYRAARYLIAGIGLLIPLFGVALRWRGAVPAPLGLAFAAATLVGQLAWRAPPSAARDWLFPPQPQPQRTGAVFGGTREGLRQTIETFVQSGPRSFHLVPPPADTVAPLRAGLDAFARHAPAGGLWIVCVENLHEQRNLGIVPGELELRGAHLASRLRESWEGQRAASLRALPAPGASAIGMLLMRAPAVTGQDARAAEARRDYEAAGLAWVETVSAVDHQGSGIEVELWMGTAVRGATPALP